MKLFEQDRKAKNIFIVSSLILAISFFVGIWALRNYFEKVRNLEASDAIERQMTQAHSELRKAFLSEAARPFAEYSFSHLEKIQVENFLKFSNIASLKPNSNIQGLIGFFQLKPQISKSQENNFVLDFPFYPNRTSLLLEKIKERRELADLITKAFVKTQVLAPTPAEEKIFSQSFAKILAPQFTEVSVKSKVTLVPAKEILSKEKKGFFVKKELPQDVKVEEELAAISQLSEIMPLQAFLIESGYIVFYRFAYHQGTRFIQGFLVNQMQFFSAIEKKMNLQISQGGQLSVILGDGFLSLFPPPQLGTTIIYRQSLPSPLDRIEVVYSISKIPLNLPQRAILYGLTLVAVLFFLGGFLLRQAILRQNETLRTQSNFVAAISHELRTPLTAIRMHGELLQKSWLKEVEKMKSYEYILSESERLSRLIENILKYSYVERKGESWQLEPKTVTEILSVIKPNLESIARSSKFELTYEIAINGNEVIKTDLDTLMQIFVNLVDNAIKFSQESPERKIVFAVGTRSTEVEFSVRDFGPGIPQESNEKIFDLFVRSENELTRKTKGTGIGLALVKVLATKMGGKIQFENLNPGCVFRVSFQNVGIVPPKA